MCWGLTLALKDWIHKSFFICAIFSISTGFYCKICFITHNWVKVQFRLINEGFSDTDPCCGQVTPPNITLHHHHHHRAAIKWVSLVYRKVFLLIFYLITGQNQMKARLHQCFWIIIIIVWWPNWRLIPRFCYELETRIYYFIIMVWKEEKVEFGPHIYNTNTHLRINFTSFDTLFNFKQPPVMRG